MATSQGLGIVGRELEPCHLFQGQGQGGVQLKLSIFKLANGFKHWRQLEVEYLLQLAFVQDPLLAQIATGTDCLGALLNHLEADVVAHPALVLHQPQETIGASAGLGRRHQATFLKPDLILFASACALGAGFQTEPTGELAIAD